MSHILDRPVWSALNTVHASHAEGDGRALRYSPSIIPFGAHKGGAPDNLVALGNLLAQGDMMLMVETDQIAIPDG
jgi:hypothetical protein